MANEWLVEFSSGDEAPLHLGPFQMVLFSPDGNVMAEAAGVQTLIIQMLPDMGFKIGEKSYKECVVKMQPKFGRIEPKDVPAEVQVGEGIEVKDG